MENLVRARVIIEGHVQGVFFRMNTRAMARSNRVSGWIRNNPNGTLEALLEGKRISVDKVIEWCHQGPDGANVTMVSVTWETHPGHEWSNEFEIKYD